MEGDFYHKSQILSVCILLPNFDQKEIPRLPISGEIHVATTPIPAREGAVPLGIIFIIHCLRQL